MALRPELVGETKEDFPIPSDGFGDVAVDHTGFPFDVSDVSPQGVLGCPSKASRRKGEVFLKSLLDYVVSDIKRKLA